MEEPKMPLVLLHAQAYWAMNHQLEALERAPTPDGTLLWLREQIRWRRILLDRARAGLRKTA